ncbi:MAG: MFS transporter [Planctomycetes bacterium]|nr:MFS transporter [Planctomycetota bacterium]
MSRARRVLERLALARPEQRAWALYDWANSAMMTVVVTAVFPIFFARVAYPAAPPGEATRVFGVATSIALAIVALTAPLLGVVADRTANKKRLLAGFAALGVAACAAMATVHAGQWVWAATLFVLANVGASASFVFYDALLPHVARGRDLDRLSSTGFALGYLGGGLCFALALVFITRPELVGLAAGADASVDARSLPTRAAFVLVAAWWGLFSLPLLRRVPEPPPVAGPGLAELGGVARAAVASLRQTLRDLLRYREAALMLLAFLCYNDGINTVIRMAAVYGEELRLEPESLMLALLLVQFVGVPATFAYGALATRLGAKRAVLLGVAAYLVIAVLARGLDSEADFFVMAGLVALVQGGTQALSRSLFASLIPARKSGEFFGLFAVFDRFAGLFGPALFTAAVAWRGDVRDGIVPIAAFFLAGGVLLTRVDVERGRARLAAEGEAA